MKVTVVIPVGPGHERYQEQAVLSVRRAWHHARGPFTELAIARVDDPNGRLGRSRARNQGLDKHPSDWHFLLDADDEMLPEAFALVDLSHAATFGAVFLSNRGVRAVYKRNVYPVTRATLFERGAHGTLSMGFFLRGDLGLRFNEKMDIGEDFDFYLRLPSFIKRVQPLVCIGYDRPSAAGPRGTDSGTSRRWLQACDTAIDRYRPAQVG